MAKNGKKWWGVEKKFFPKVCKIAPKAFVEVP